MITATTTTTITLLQHLKIYSIVIGIIATVFWTWAIINTIQNQIIDVGIISSLAIICSNIYIFYLTTTNNNNNNNDRCSLQSIGTSWCEVGSYLFVTLNYFAGTIVNFSGNYNIGQAIYCINIVYQLVLVIIHRHYHHHPMLTPSERHYTSSTDRS